MLPHVCYLIYHEKHIATYKPLFLWEKTNIQKKKKSY